MTNNEIVKAKIAELVKVAEPNNFGSKTIPTPAMEEFAAFLLDNYPPVTTREEQEILSTFFRGGNEDRRERMKGNIDDLPPALVPIFALRSLLLIHNTAFDTRAERTGELIDRYQRHVLAA